MPLTIARMNWSYGSELRRRARRIITRVAQGEPVPVNPDWEFVGCPIHEDDMAEHLDGFFDGATVGGTVTNWGGDNAVRSSCWSRGLRSSSAPLTPSPAWKEIIAYPRDLDNARRTSLAGECKVKWPEGFRRMIEERFPGRLAQAGE